VVKSRRIRWARHVAHMGKMRNAYKILIVKPEWRDHSEDLGIDVMIILKLFLGK
jgi:hypothetical protein